MKLKYIFSFNFFFLLISIKCIIVDNNDLSDSNNGPILLRGWLKYFTYSPNSETTEKPNKFHINQQYFHQFDSKNKLNILNTNLKDDYGFINIPSKFHFFFVLSKETLYVVSSRRVSITIIKCVYILIY